MDKLRELSLVRDKLFAGMYEDGDINCARLAKQASSLLILLQDIYSDSIIVSDVAALISEFKGHTRIAVSHRKTEVNKI